MCFTLGGRSRDFASGEVAFSTALFEDEEAEEADEDDLRVSLSVVGVNVDNEAVSEFSRTYIQS